MTRRSRMMTGVMWFDKAIAILLLILWMPATSLCLVEQSGLLEIECPSSDECCPTQPAEASTCCLLASGFYKLNDDDRLWVVAPSLALTVESNSAEAFCDWNPLCSEPLILPPPELVVSWQFSVRTAPIPRAPSIAS